MNKKKENEEELVEPDELIGEFTESPERPPESEIEELEEKHGERVVEPDSLEVIKARKKAHQAKLRGGK